MSAKEWPQSADLGQLDDLLGRISPDAMNPEAADGFLVGLACAQVVDVMPYLPTLLGRDLSLCDLSVFPALLTPL